MIGNGRTALADTLDILTAELEQLIDRHFAAHRTLVVERESAKHWTASIGDTVLYRSPDVYATLRFANAFANKTPGINVEIPMEYVNWNTLGYSVRVDNVVPIRAEA